MKEIMRRLPLVGLAMVTALAWGQDRLSEIQRDRDEEELGRPQRTKQVPSEGGLWLTPRALELAIDRMTDKMSERYGFDDDQLYQTRASIKQRLPRWLDENRAEIMTLTNQWVEMMLGGEPPDPQLVEQWSQRVLPLVREAQGIVDTVADDMNEFLTEDQRVILEGERAAFGVGVGFLQTRLRGWADGHFDPVNDWHRNPEAREIDRERQQEVETAMNTARDEAIRRAGGNPEDYPPPGGPAAAGPGSAASVEPGSGKPVTEVKPGAEAQGPSADEWARYVAEFIRRYSLNDEQQTSAVRFLDTKREQRDKYLARKGSEMERLQKLYKEAQTKEQVARAEETYKKLNAPVERMFTQLKEKLETLPTRAQRRDAAKAVLEQRAGTQPAKKPPAVQPGELKPGNTGAGARKESPSSP